MFRGSARAFSGDAEALRLARIMNSDRPRYIDPLTSYQQGFVVIPFEHRCVRTLRCSRNSECMQAGVLCCSEDLKDHVVGEGLMEYAIGLAQSRGASNEEVGPQ